MPLFGKIVVIRRDGVDGAQFPLTTATCIFGRNADCDIRVQLPNVAKEHCRIEVDADGNIFLVNLCPVYPTLLNKKAVTKRVQVQHMDVFTVTDRSFRVELPPGSPFRKSSLSTDSVSPIQSTGPVKSENVMELWTEQLSTLMVKDEPLLSISTNTEQSAAEKESSPRKMGIKYTPKGKTPTAKARTPSYSVRTPLQKGKAVSPAVRSSASSKVKTPTGVKRGTHTHSVGHRSAHSRTGNTSTVTPRSKTPAFSSSLAKSNSALLADEIAELKLALTKHKEQSPARTSVLKTPVGTARLHDTTGKAKTPAAGDKIKTPSVTPRVRSNIAPTPKSKTLISASILKTPVVTPAAKTPVSIKSKSLATKTSSVHRIKKVMTPSPRAKAQKRRSSSIPSPAVEIRKRPPLRNTVPQTDSLDASEEDVDPTLEASLGDKTSNETASFAGEKSSVHRVKGLTPSPRATAQRRRSSSIPSPAIEIRKRPPLRDTVPQTDGLDASEEAVDSTLETSLGDKTSNEIASFSGEKSHSRNLSPAQTLGRLKTGSPKISSPTGPSTHRKSLSPVTRSPGNSLTRSKSHSPRRGPAKISSEMSQSTEILTKKRRSSSSTNAGANKVAKDSPQHQISSPANNMIPPPEHVEAVDSILEIALQDKASDEAVSSNGKSHTPKLTPSDGHARRKSRSSKVSSPGEPPARVKSQSPNVEAHITKTTKSPGSCLTRIKSQSPDRGTEKSHSPFRGSAEKLSEGVETPVLHRRSSTRPSIGAKQSQLRGKSHSPVRRSVESSVENLSQGVKTPALPRRSSSRPSVGSKQSPLHEVLSQASGANVTQVRMEAMHSTVATSIADTASGEIFSPTNKKTKSPKLSPAEVRDHRKSLSSLTRSPRSLTRSKSQSPLGSSAEFELSAQKQLQSSQMSPVDEDKTKRKLQSALESPAEVSQRMSRRLTTSSTRSKSQSPLRSPTEPSNGSPPDCVTHSKLQSPKGFPGKTSTRRKSQYPEASSPSKNQDSSPAVTDECFLESYKQQHETSASRKSQYLEASSPSQYQDSTPAVTDECFLESYDQQFSPLILEMDDLDENKDSPIKTTSISSPVPKGGSDPGSLKSAVGRLRRKSQPLLEESEDEIFSTKSAGKEIDTTLEEFDQTFGEQSFVSPSQGVKRRGSPLKGRPPKKRCVSFGPDMSPELFDRSLPVATPLKRGATPRRTSTSVDQMDIQSKPLLKNRRSMLSTAAATLLEEPLEARSGKPPKDLKVMEKLSKGVRQNPVLESMTTLNAEVFAVTDLEPSQPVITPLRRQAKPRRASVVEAVVYPTSLRKRRRATLATAGVIPEAPLEENPEKSPKSSKVQAKEDAVVVVDVVASADAKVMTASEIQTPISSVFSPVMVGSQTGSQNRKIFTSGTGTKRLSRALKTLPAADGTTSNENSPAVKTPARKEKTPKLRQSLTPRRSHPLTNMQNSSVLHQELDPFAFESSPESSPTRLTPKPTGQSKKVEISAAVSEDLTRRVVLESGKKKLLSKSQEDITTPNVLESGKKKLLSKSQEDITTPKVSLDFTGAKSATSLVKSSRSVGRSSAKDVSLEQEHGLQETPTTIVTEELRSAGRRSAKAKPVNEAVYETPAETTPNIPRSIGRRSSKPVTEAVDETLAETTPNIPRSIGRRSSKPEAVTEAVDETPAETTPNIPRSIGRRSSKPEAVTEAVDETPAETTPIIPRSIGRRSSKPEAVTEAVYETPAKTTPNIPKSIGRRSSKPEAVTEAVDETPAETTPNIPRSIGRRSSKPEAVTEAVDETPAETTPIIPRSIGRRSSKPEAVTEAVYETPAKTTPNIPKSIGRRSSKPEAVTEAVYETPAKTTPNIPRSIGRRSSKPEAVTEAVDETPAKTTPNIPKSIGRRSSKPEAVTEAVYETPAETTPNIPRSTARRSSRFLEEEHITELTPVVDKSSSRRSASCFKLSSAKADEKATPEQVFASEERRSRSCDSAAKTPRSTSKRGRQAKSEENLKTPDAETIGKASTGSPALLAADGIPTPKRFSERKSSSPFKRPFGSEPRKLRLSKIGELFRLSPDETRRAGRAKNMAGQMVSERNIDLSSLSPLKFYKSPAVEALTGKRSKVTPGRAVALRAVYGKSAVPPLAELVVSRKASGITSADRSEKAEVADESTKSLPAEKSPTSKVMKRKKSTIQVAAKKNLEKKTGFAVKKKQTKVLLLKRVGRRSVGQVVKRFLPATQRNRRAKSDSAQMGQNSLPNIAENDVLEVSSEKAQTLAESSKSPSSYSVLLTPNGPGEMSVSPWSSSPVLASSRKHRSGDRIAIADDTSKGQSSPSFAGLQKRLLASPGEGNSPNVSGMNSPVKTSQVESSPQLIGVKQLVKTPKSENSPQLRGVRKLVKTPTVQKSPQLSGVKKLVKTPKVQKSPKLIGVRNLVKTPKTQNSPKLSGVKVLVKTPKVHKSPQLSGVRKLVKTPKVQKSPQLIGVRNLVKTPKTQKSPKLIGVKNLVKTPKVQKSPQLIGIRNLVKTPKMQKSPKLNGVRVLVKTPKDQKSPRVNGVKKLVKTPKVQKSPRLSGVKNLMRTPKVQESPDLTGVKALVKSPRQLRTPQLDGLKDLVSTPRVLGSPESSGLNELVQSPATQSSLQPSSIRKTVKTPKTQQSAKRESIRKSLKTPRHERSPRLGGVKALAKTPKMRPTPKLSGLRNLVRTPKAVLSPELEGVRELFQNPSVQLSAKETRVKSPVKSPEATESSQFGAKLGSPEASAVKQSTQKAKSANKSLKSSVTPIVTELKEPLEFAPMEDVTPVRPLGRPQKQASQAKSTGKSLKSSVTPIITELKEPQELALEGVTPVRSVGCPRKQANQAKSTDKSLKSSVTPIVTKLKEPREFAPMEDVTPVRPVEHHQKQASQAKSTDKLLKSSVAPIVTELKEPQEFAPLEDVTPVRPVGRSRKLASRTGVEKVKDIPQLSKENIHNDENVGKEDKTVAAKTRKRQIAESDEKPAARKRRLAVETEDSTKNDGKELHSAVKKGRGSKKVGAETSTRPSEIEVTASLSSSGGCLRKEKGTESSALQGEKLQVMSAAPSPKLARSRNSRSQKAGQVTVEENVPATVEETVKLGARRQARSSKKDLPEEPAVMNEDKAKSKTRAKGKGKATQAEMEVVVQKTEAENVEVLIPPATEKSEGRQRGRAKKDAIKEVVPAEAVEKKAERKTSARGKAVATVASEQVTVEENVKSPVAVKVGNRRRGKVQDDAVEELNVQSKAIAIVPERKSRAKAQGKTKQTDTEVEVNVEASVQETAKLGGRRQVRSLTKDISEEADTQSESVANKTGSKVGSRGNAKTQLTKAVEEKLEKTVRPNARTKKQAAKEDMVESSAAVDYNADETVEVKRPVRGRKMKPDEDKAEGKGRTVVSKETALAVDNQTTGLQLNKTENAVVASGKRGRKGVVVQPVSSATEVVTEVVQSYKTENAVVASGKRGRKGVVVQPVSSATEVVTEVVQSYKTENAVVASGKRGRKGVVVQPVSSATEVVTEVVQSYKTENAVVASGKRGRKGVVVQPVSSATEVVTEVVQSYKTENAVVASGKRGRKGAVVEPVSSAAEIVTEVVQSSRKRKAKTVEEIAPTETKKARMHVEAMAIKTAKEVSPKPSKRGSKKTSTGAANNRDGNVVANENLIPADDKPTEIPARSRNKRKTEIARVSSTTDEEIKANSVGKKQGKSSSRKAESAESSEAPKSKNTVTSQRQKTIKQISNEVDHAVDSQPKGRGRNVKFDVPPTTAVDALEKAAQSTARGHSGASKRGSENKTASKESPATVPKARVSRSASALKDTAPLPAKRASRK